MATHNLHLKLVRQNKKKGTLSSEQLQFKKHNFERWTSMNVVTRLEVKMPSKQINS